MVTHSDLGQRGLEEQLFFIRGERDRLLKDLEGERNVSLRLSRDLDRIVSEKMAVEVKNDKLQKRLVDSEMKVSALEAELEGLKGAAINSADTERVHRRALRLALDIIALYERGENDTD